MAKCILEDKECNDCGACEVCPYEDKICDNCFQCLKIETDYRGILIDHVELEGESPIS